MSGTLPSRQAGFLRNTSSQGPRLLVGGHLSTGGPVSPEDPACVYCGKKFSQLHRHMAICPNRHVLAVGEQTTVPRESLHSHLSENLRLECLTCGAINPSHNCQVHCITTLYRRTFPTEGPVPSMSSMIHALSVL